MAKRRNPATPPLPASPLDARQRALAETEAKIRAQMERAQKVIEEAPKIARERERIRREEIVTRASRTDRRPGSRTALPDRRFGLEANVAAPAQRRRLRAERREGRPTFFILLLILSGVLCWLYYIVTHP